MVRINTLIKPICWYVGKDDDEDEHTDQGGEAGSVDQVYKDQHPLHGAQLSQVREIMIQSYNWRQLDHLMKDQKSNDFAKTSAWCKIAQWERTILNKFWESKLCL